MLSAGSPAAALPSVDVPQAAVPPLISADLKDPAWKNAVTLSPLTLSIGAPDKSVPVPATLVSLLWDAKFVYVRLVCDDTDIYVPVHGRDSDLFRGDVVEVFLDPVGDSREFVEIEVSPDNDVMDKLHLITSTFIGSDDNGVLNQDIIDRDQWSMIGFDVVGLVTNAKRVPLAVTTPGWVVDMAIPATCVCRRLGAGVFSPMTMRINFIRYDEQDAATPSGHRFVAMNWAPVRWGQPHRSPQVMGYVRLVGR